jgi:carbamoyl-phosphate synthase large subunit
MKSVGEVMAIGRTFGQAFAKAMRSRELDEQPDLGGDLLARLAEPSADRYDVMLEAFRQGHDLDAVHGATSVDPWYLRQLRTLALDPEAPFAGLERTYRAVDTCAAEFEAETPYYYSAWERPGMGPAGDPPRRPAERDDPRLGPQPDRAGDRVRLLLRARGDDRARVRAATR